MKRKGISRREFLKGTAGGVGIAALGLLGSSTAPVVKAAESSAAPEGTAQEASGSNDILNPQNSDYDSFTTDYSAIFSPIQVGAMTLRNRIIKPAAGSDTAIRGEAVVSQNCLDYYGRMADGGAALIIAELGSIRSLGFDPNSLDNAAVEDLEDGIGLAKPLADRIHEGGAYAGYQISFGGLGEPVVNDVSVEDIKKYIEDMTACMIRLQKAGFDCVEIKGATTDGLNAFLSRRQNMREDEYGPQSLENRARFFVEIIQAIKEACGKDFGVLTLINGVEESDNSLGQNDKYITIEESREFAKMLEAAGADLIQVRVGTPGKEITCWAPDCNHAAYQADGLTGFGTQFDYSAHFEGMLDGSHSGVGEFIPLAREIKSVVNIPVGCAGYIDPRTAPDMMNNAIAIGDMDLLFINRPLTVDPELPNKLKEGLRDEVAPCTRCLHCHDQTLGLPECCRVNATTQHAYKEEMPEGYDLPPAETVKNVMVVGGGPAGMEAARVAAERGHKVTLYEENSYLGGLLPFAAAIKGGHERLEDMRRYMSVQLERKGVDVITGQLVDAGFIAGKAPDAVVLALGGLRESKLDSSGIDSPNVINAPDIMSAEIGERVVILGVGAQAVDMAVYLLAMGKKIQMVHDGMANEVDKEQSAWFQQFIPPHLYARGVKIWHEAQVKEVVNGGIVIITDAGIEKTLDCDTVMECYDMINNTDIYEAIKDTYEVYAVGDCAEPYNIQKAVYSANIAARSI